MARYGEVRPLNLFADYMAGKQAAQDQQVTRQQNALRDLQLQRVQSLNALGQNPNATPEQYIRAGDAATGNALANVQQQQQVDKQQALTQLAGLAQKALSIQDPAQRKAFLASPEVSQFYGSAFQALGADHGKGLAELQQLPDEMLQQRLSQVAQFAAPPKGTTVAPGATYGTVDNAGKFTPQYSAPDPGKEETARHNRAMEANAALTAKNSATANQLTNETKQQNIIGKLRDDYTGIVKSTGWPDQQGFYQRLKSVANDKTGASDLALVFSYMKVLDPTSAVREGEYANAANTGGVPDWVIARYNKILDGEILAPNQRKNFIDAADKIYSTAYSRQQAIKKDFTDKATRAKVNPQDVLVDFGAPPPSAGTQAQAQGPTATGPNGQKLILQNGQWVPLNGK